MKVNVGMLALISFIAISALNSAHATSYSHKCGSGGSNYDTETCDTFSAEYTYDLSEDGVDYGFGDANSFVNIDGITVQITTWSDTGDNDTLEMQGALSQYGDGYGLSNNHSYDNHAIDNYLACSRYNCTEDYDYVLLSFSEAVSLTGATFSWLGDENDTQVSVVGITDFNNIPSTLTWASVSSMVDDSYKGSFDVEECDDVYTSTFTDLSEPAQYWLVGAYNTVFGEVAGASKYNDAFKIATIGFDSVDGTTPPASGDNPTPVNEPGSLAILLVGSLVALRRKKQD